MHLLAFTILIQCDSVSTMGIFINIAIKIFIAIWRLTNSIFQLIFVGQILSSLQNNNSRDQLVIMRLAFIVAIIAIPIIEVTITKAITIQIAIRLTRTMQQ